MKKLLYIFIAILTCSIGILSCYLYFLFMPVSVYKVREFIPLYKLERDTQRYISNKIILQEDLVVTRDSDDYSLSYNIQARKEKCDFFYDCSNVLQPDCLATTYINFTAKVAEREVRLIEEIAEKNSQLFKSNARSGIYGAKVEIEGYIRTSEIFDNYFTIDVVNIKQVSPIRFISNEEMSKPK